MAIEVSRRTDCKNNHNPITFHSIRFICISLSFADFRIVVILFRVCLFICLSCLVFDAAQENLSDGTVAPWFWYVLFGPVGALGYRVANTLDSRIGYRGGRYEWFGKASARFDDLINLIPARLTALLLCVAAQGVDGCSFSGGLQTAWEDRRQCSSPNAGWPMGAMAGILGVRLEKRGEYCLGKTIPGARGPTPWDIRKGHRVAQRAGGLALVVAVCACSIKEWMIAS
jgi:adenosylcobinamide-phosphate synthase